MEEHPEPVQVTTARTVYVPGNRLEEAREALAEADAQGQVDGDEPPTEENPTDAE